MKKRVKILISALMIVVLSMSLFISAYAAPNVESTSNAATASSEWTIYGRDGSTLKQFRVTSGVVIGPGSKDYQYSGQSPVSAAQAGLNLLKICYPLSYSDLAVDGDFGGASTQATKDFQLYVHNNIDSSVMDDGWIGSLTWPHLADCSRIAFYW